MIEPRPTPEDLNRLGIDPGAVHGQGLVAALTALVQGLRAAGVRVGTGGLADGLRAAALVGPGSGERLRAALAANLAGSVEELEIFHALFNRFFLGESPPMDELSGQPPTDHSAQPAQSLWSMVEESPGRVDEPARNPYSPAERLGSRNLEELTPTEAGLAARLLTERLENLLNRRTARLKPDNRATRIDFRRTWRASLALGGEILELARRGPRIRKRRLVLLLDVSGSMDAHTYFMLLLGHLWVRHFPDRAEVFGFSTRLRRLTPALKDRTLTAALGEVGQRMPEFSGGTRIGAALQKLLSGEARGLVNGSALVVIFSDGWDRGQIPLLRRQMRRLKERAWRVMWLNPLLGSPGYEPLCAGMRTALDHLDSFLPAHSLDSLLAAGRTIARTLETDCRASLKVTR